MNAPAETPVSTLEPGAPFGGGIFVTRYRHGADTRALILARLADWNRPAASLQKKPKSADALSFVDGLANTDALAAAGSAIAQQVRGLKIGGFDDWHIPAVNQLELIFRRLRPGKDECSNWYRSGMNTAAIPPTEPYNIEPATQTEAPWFQDGGSEALDQVWHWTSTQHAAYSDHAWVQTFGDGNQSGNWKDFECRVLAVRSVVIQ